MDEYSKNKQLTLNLEPGQVNEKEAIVMLFKNKIAELFKNDGYTMPSIKFIDIDSLPNKEEWNQVTGQPWQSAEQNKWKVEFDAKNLGEITLENLNYSINVRHNIKKILADIPYIIENEDTNPNHKFKIVENHVLNYLLEKTGLDITSDNVLKKYHIAINIWISGFKSIGVTLETEFKSDYIDEEITTSDYFTSKVTKWYWVVTPKN